MRRSRSKQLASHIYLMICHICIKLPYFSIYTLIDDDALDNTTRRQGLIMHSHSRYHLLHWHTHFVPRITSGWAASWHTPIPWPRSARYKMQWIYWASRLTYRWVPAASIAHAQCRYAERRGFIWAIQYYFVLILFQRYYNRAGHAFDLGERDTQYTASRSSSLSLINLLAAAWRRLAIRYAIAARYGYRENSRFRFGWFHYHTRKFRWPSYHISSAFYKWMLSFADIVLIY